MKTSLRYLVFSALALMSLAAQAEVKIGFVDSERIFRESKAAKQAEEKLSREFQARDKAINKEADELKAQAAVFEKNKDKLSEAARAQQQRDLMNKDRDLERKRREFQEDLSKRKKEELQGVIAKADEKIRQIAKREKFTLILQEAVYADPAIDLTARVIKELE